jgi:hypothetical protein
MFECDGCGLVGDLEVVEAHILEQDLNGPIKCWGAMEVGGPAWEAFHGNGVHPMISIVNMVTKKYLELFGEEL